MILRQTYQRFGIAVSGDILTVLCLWSFVRKTVGIIKNENSRFNRFFYLLQSRLSSSECSSMPLEPYSPLIVSRIHYHDGSI